MRCLVLSCVFACGASKPTPPIPAGDPGPAVPAPAPAPAPMPVAEAPAAKPAVPALDPAFLTSCREQLGNGKAQLELLLNVTGPRKIDNTLEVYNEMSRYLANAGNMAGLAQEVNPSAGVRDAARQCEREVQQFVSELLLDRRVFDAIKAVDVKRADAATRRFVMTTLRDYKRAGVDLPEAQRTRIKQIDDESTLLAQEHSKNISDDTRWIEVTDKARLAGMPADWIAAHKPDGAGVIKITTDYPDYIPFITYADDDDLRKQLYMKFRSRGDAHNEEVLQKLLVLRAEKAKLLGFKDWADYQSDDKMLRGGKNAAAFIERVNKLAKARAAKASLSPIAPAWPWPICAANVPNCVPTMSASSAASPPGPNRCGKCAGCSRPSMTLASVTVSGPPRR